VLRCRPRRRSPHAGYCAPKQPRRPVPYGLVSKHRPASDLKIVIESTPEFGIGADDPGSVVISCADEASARKEAERQQGSETYGAQWNYLRLDGH